MAASRSDPASEEFDAIVVGSGISGGWAAKELTEKGLKTLLLEAGPPIVPSRDYVEHLQASSLPYRGYGNLKKLYAEQPIQSQTGACNEWGAKFFVNDHENPYEYDPKAPFTWIRGRHVGGRSIMWGRQVYRWSDLDFEANAKEGIGVDWPIRYADIAPWYSHVEKFIGVSGQAEGLAQLPDGEFLPPMQLNCAETARAGGDGQAVRPRAGAHHRPLCDPHPAAPGARGLPLLRAVRARLHHRVLLQQHRLDAAGGAPDRPPDAAAEQRGRGGHLR